MAGIKSLKNICQWRTKSWNRESLPSLHSISPSNILPPCLPSSVGFEGGSKCGWEKKNELVAAMNLSPTFFLPNHHPLPATIYHNGHSSPFARSDKRVVRVGLRVRLRRVLKLQYLQQWQWNMVTASHPKNKNKKSVPLPLPPPLVWRHYTQ